MARREANKGCTCPICGATFDAKTGNQKYCSQRCKGLATGRRYEAKLRARRTPRPMRACGSCGQDFAPVSVQHLYCSAPCKEARDRQAQRERRGQMFTSRPCTICRAIFETWRPPAKKLTCGPACRREASRRRSLAHYYAKRARPAADLAEAA